MLSFNNRTLSESSKHLQSMDFNTEKEFYDAVKKDPYVKKIAGSLKAIGIELKTPKYIVFDNKVDFSTDISYDVYVNFELKRTKPEVSIHTKVKNIVNVRDIDKFAGDVETAIKMADILKQIDTEKLPHYEKGYASGEKHNFEPVAIELKLGHLRPKDLSRFD